MRDDVYEVRVLRAGSFELPGPAEFQGAHWFDWLKTVITVVLLRNLHRTVLVDTGVGNPGHYNDILVQGLGERARFDSDVSMAIEDVLAAAEVGIEDIDFILPSHLHWDHASNVGAFPDADLILTEEAWRAVDRPRHPEILDPGAYQPESIETLRSRERAGRLGLVPSGSEVLPGISVERVGGHSPCSQLITVRSRAGNVLLPADNVGFFEHLESRIPPAIMFNLGEWYELVARIAREDAPYVPSHDPLVFDRFPDGRVG